MNLPAGRHLIPHLLICVLLSSLLFSQSTPYFQLREHESQYHGPGRNEAVDSIPAEIRIGFFGPTDPSGPDEGHVWIAAQLAIEDSNRDGGYQGSPFRLVPSWSDNPWGSGISKLARSIYADDLWAIIGSIDGPSTHLAEQLVAKARLTLINPASSDKTVNLANVPWMFSCLPGEHTQVPVLAESIVSVSKDSVLTLLSGTDHDSRVLSKELRKQLSGLGASIAHHFELDEASLPCLDTVEQVVAARSEIVVIIAGASASADLVKELRKRQFQGHVFGGPPMASGEFLRRSGAAAIGVTFPLLANNEGSVEFNQRFETRCGFPPDFRAVQTYDAVILLVEAVRKAGLNRARIRDAVRSLSPWQGLSGPIIWDPLGQNTRPVRLATVTQANTFELR